MNLKALVVDDSPTVRSMLQVPLKDMGFTVLTALDGVRALQIIGDMTMDIIITDINMPNMDGIELIHQLRALESSKYTPILVVTTEGGENAKKAGKEAGASGWIVKPVDPEVLKKAVGKLCNLQG